MQQASVRISEASGLQHLCASNSAGTRECSVLQFATEAQDSLHLSSSSENNTNSSFLQKPPAQAEGKHTSFPVNPLPYGCDICSFAFSGHSDTSFHLHLPRKGPLALVHTETYFN